MKLCAAADSNTLNSTVAQRFSRCKYFLIIDMDTGEFTTPENQNRTLRDGAGVGAAGDVLGFNIQAVITQNIATTAFNLLKTREWTYLLSKPAPQLKKPSRNTKKESLPASKNPPWAHIFRNSPI